MIDADAAFQPVVHLDDIDAAWLTRALTRSGVLSDGARVAGVERCNCGTGQLADSYRFTLSYEPRSTGPSTVVGKFPSEDVASRAFGKQSGYYRTEIRFYQRLAPTLRAMELPTPLYAELADNETDFVLLMEDLAPARTVDQLVGCTTDEAAVVVEQAAALHASSWCSPQLARLDWLKGAVASFLRITDGLPETTASFPETFGDLVPECDLREAARLNTQLDAWKRVLATPQCLWHSDLRADNLLFDARNGATPVVVLDWQGVGYGYGPIDVAYFLGTSVTTENRRKCERDLINLYRDRLAAQGVEGYSAEDAWEDYRVLAIHPLQTGIFGMGAVKRSERGDEMWRQWIARSAQLTRDLDSYTALKAR